MEPILNPFWIYLFPLIGNLNSLSYFCLVIVTIVVSATVFGGFIMDDREEPATFLDYLHEKLKNKHFKNLKNLFIALIILKVFIPSQETVRNMMIASYVTPNNIEAVGDYTKEGIDYLFEKIDSLLSEPTAE